MSSSELRDQEEAACAQVFRPNATTTVSYIFTWMIGLNF